MAPGGDDERFQVRAGIVLPYRLTMMNAEQERNKMFKRWKAERELRCRMNEHRQRFEKVFGVPATLPNAEDLERDSAKILWMVEAVTLRIVEFAMKEEGFARSFRAQYRCQRVPTSPYTGEKMEALVHFSRIRNLLWLFRPGFQVKEWTKHPSYLEWRTFVKAEDARRQS